MDTLLEERLRRCDFLQLVRTLLRPHEAGHPPRKLDRAVSFRADLGAAFPGRNATALEEIGGAQDIGPWSLIPAADARYVRPNRPRVRITTPDFCVGSVLGPLPEAFLEWMRDLERAGNHGMRDFLDVFNHRINALRYYTRSTFEPGLNNLPPERTLQAEWLGSLMGVGSEDAAGQIPLRERNWLGIGELLANNRRSAAGVEQVLAAHLRCPVRLTPLVPVWRPLGKDNEHALGARRLGIDSLLGRSLWDVQAAIKLDIGPVDYAGMAALLPPLPVRPADLVPATPQGDEPSARDLQRQWRAQQVAVASGQQPRVADGHEALAALVRLMLDRRHDARLDIHIPERGVPPSLLTTFPAPGLGGLRLGQTAWLKSRSRSGRVRRGPAGRMRTVSLEVTAHPDAKDQ